MGVAAISAVGVMAAAADYDVVAFPAGQGPCSTFAGYARTGTCSAASTARREGRIATITTGGCAAGCYPAVSS